MKKNDGYVVICVVFVILFLCIVAAGTCTSALSNLKAQNAAVEQLQARCTVEGNIEQFMSEVCVDPAHRTGEDIASIEEAAETVRNVLSGYVISAAGSQSSLIYSYDQFWTQANNSDKFICRLTASTAHAGSTAIAAIEFSASVTVYERELTDTDNPDENDEAVTVYDYSIDAVTSKYLSFRLENSGGGAQ